MIENIYNVLTNNGTSLTLGNLAFKIFQFGVKMLHKVVSFFVTPIINKFGQLIPPIDLTILVENGLDQLVNVCIYILDVSFLKRAVLVYLIGSIIARVLMKSAFYLIKVVINWWHVIVP